MVHFIKISSIMALLTLATAIHMEKDETVRKSWEQKLNTVLNKEIESYEALKKQVEKIGQFMPEPCQNVAKKIGHVVKVPDVRNRTIFNPKNKRWETQFCLDKEGLDCGIIAGMLGFCANEISLQGNLKTCKWITQETISKINAMVGEEKPDIKPIGDCRAILEQQANLSLVRRTPFFRLAAFLTPAVITYNYIVDQSA